MSVFLLGLREDMLNEEQVERLKAALPEGMSLLFTVDHEAFAPHAEEIEVAAGWFRSKWIREMTNLKWVHQWGAGTDWLLEYPDLIEKPFTLTNSVGVSAIPMSEHILGMMLYHSRNFRNALAAQKEKHWAKLFHPTEDHQSHPRNLSWEDMAELAGQTVLLVGVGAIGQRVARLAKAFDMTVIGLRNNPAKQDPNVDRMVGIDQLISVLPEADFIVTTVPMTEASRNQFGSAEFQAMKRSAYFINLGRGGTVDEEAMIDALQSGEIAGAGLDVFTTEPLPTESPLWEMENVMITSHYSGGTRFYHTRALEILIDNLGRYQRGEPLRNLVDKARGY